MKAIVIIFLLLISLLSNAQDIINLPKQSVDTVDIDTIVNQKNYLLNVETDTLFIINRRGIIQYHSVLNEYRSIRSKYKEVENVMQILNDVDFEFQNLNKNIRALEDNYAKSLQNNIENNSKLIEENMRISKELEAATRNLSEAKTKIKNERWNSMGKKLLWGAGGVIIGTLVGGTLIAVSN